MNLFFKILNVCRAWIEMQLFQWTFEFLLCDSSCQRWSQGLVLRCLWSDCVCYFSMTENLDRYVSLIHRAE